MEGSLLFNFSSDTLSGYIYIAYCIKGGSNWGGKASRKCQDEAGFSVFCHLKNKGRPKVLLFGAAFPFS
jgi:hypothetical protein